jgi:hypothetical protein
LLFLQNRWQDKQTSERESAIAADSQVIVLHYNLQQKYENQSCTSWLSINRPTAGF